MKKYVSYLGSFVVALSALVALSVQQTAQAHGPEQEKSKPKDLVPVVFQALNLKHRAAALRHEVSEPGAVIPAEEGS